MLLLHIATFSSLLLRLEFVFINYECMNFCLQENVNLSNLASTILTVISIEFSYEMDVTKTALIINPY